MLQEARMSRIVGKQAPDFNMATATGDGKDLEELV